nr:3D domain-containing protein [Verrucomicrobiota bacterium]
SCETATVAHPSTRNLPTYEPPLARADLQQVRTTAYTHTESDHLAYGAHNALGGPLQSASLPRGRADAGSPFIPMAESAPAVRNFTLGLTTRARKIAAGKNKKASREKKTAKRSKKSAPFTIGSAAADWSRWPLGTKFQIVSTGQIYQIDDYGWALSGRNTIDLYMGSRGEMNRWGVRNEPIKILKWGDPRASMAFLERHQEHKHIHRMVLELQGQDAEAAALN